MSNVSLETTLSSLAKEIRPIIADDVQNENKIILLQIADALWTSLPNITYEQYVHIWKDKIGKDIGKYMFSKNCSITNFKCPNL